MITIIVLVAVVLIIMLLVYAAMKPDRFRVQRSAKINAPAEKIFCLINDLHSWMSWSPWEKMDPLLKRHYNGTTQGKGAVYQWEGNNKVGKGEMEIVEAAPPSKIVIKLDFLKPFETHNIAEFTLGSQGDSTNVTWAMHGPQPFMAKVMSVFCSMDSMVGTQFEEGLANLKAVTEK